MQKFRLAISSSETFDAVEIAKERFVLVRAKFVRSSSFSYNVEFEIEQLKYFTQSLTTSYDFIENIFLNALLTANSNDLS